MSTETAPKTPSALALAALREVQRHIDAAADPDTGLLPYGDADPRGYWYRAWYLRATPGAHGEPHVEVLHTESLHPLQQGVMARVDHMSHTMIEHGAVAIVTAAPPFSSPAHSRCPRVHPAVVEMAYTDGGRPVTCLGTLQGIRPAPGAAPRRTWRWAPGKPARQLQPTITQPQTAAATARRRRRRVESASIRPMPLAVAQPSTSPAPVSPPPSGPGGTDGPRAVPPPHCPGTVTFAVGGDRR